MGGALCSNYAESRITSFRNAISSSNIDEIKSIITSSSSKEPISFISPFKYVTQLCSKRPNFNLNHMSVDDMINCQIDSKGNTPLTLAIETCQLKSFKHLLLQLNADPNICNYVTGLSPLHMLAASKCQANSTFKARKFSGSSYNTILISPTRANQFDMDDFTNMSEETLREMVYMLVDKGADLNKTIKSNIEIDTDQVETNINPLMFSLKSQNCIVAEELLNLGCDCNYQEESVKLSGLHLACYLSNFELASLIMDDEMRFVKIKLDLKSNNGNSCLHWLALSKSDDDIGIFKMIINCLTKRYTRSNASSPISCSNSSEFAFNTPTLDKSHFNSNDLDKYLKTFLDQTNNEGQTALMLASMNNKQHLVRQMLDFDATINLKDHHGKTAFDYAKKNQQCSQIIESFSKLKTMNIKKSVYKLNSLSCDSVLHSQSQSHSNLNEINKSGDIDAATSGSSDLKIEDLVVGDSQRKSQDKNIMNIEQLKNNLAKII